MGSMKAPLGEAVQQLPLPAVPPNSAHRSALVTRHELLVQSASVTQDVSGSLVQAPLRHEPVDATTQATELFLPQVEAAAQGTILFAQRRLRPILRSRSRVACATQRTYWP
jgi:hypothetical protein